MRQRKGRLRLSDGRILKFQCRALLDGGRMMTFTDISDLVRIADQLRELSDVDDLTRLPNRRQFLRSLVVPDVRRSGRIIAYGTVCHIWKRVPPPPDGSICRPWELLK